MSNIPCSSTHRRRRGARSAMRTIEEVEVVSDQCDHAEVGVG